MRRQVAVCGPANADPIELMHARRVGELLAEAGAVVLCGGGAGVMGAAAGGARSRKGLVIGIRPGTDLEGASDDLSAVVLTGMGEARNVILVRSADVVIAIGGSWGTLSEIALAVRGGTPVISLGGWRVLGSHGGVVEGIGEASSPEEAVERALKI